MWRSGRVDALEAGMAEAGVLPDAEAAVGAEPVADAEAGADGEAAVGVEPAAGAEPEAAGGSFFHSAMERVRMYSVGPVRLAAIQSRVLAWQVARMASRSWLLR